MLQQNRIPQATKRTAAFHPVSSVEHFNGVLLIPGVQTGNQRPNLVRLKKLMNLVSLLFGESPKLASERNGWTSILNAFLGKMPPFSIQGFLHDQLDWFQAVSMGRFLSAIRLQGCCIALHHLLQHERGGYARKV